MALWGTISGAIEWIVRNACLWLFALLLLLPSVACAEPTLEGLDEIFMRRGGIRNFLKDPELQNEYYEALRGYLRLEREEFPPKVFKSFLTELVSLEGEVPGLYDRLMETNNLGVSFKFTSEKDTTIPEVSPAIWNRLVNRLQDNLEGAAGSDRSKRLQDDEVKAGLDLFEGLNLAIKTKTEGLGAKQKKIQSQRILSEARKDPRYRKAAARLALHALHSPESEQALRGGSSSDILNVFDRIQSSTERGGALPPIASTFIRDLLVAPREINEIADLWSSGATPVDGEIAFVVSPRRFHAIWKGFALKECVGGNCLKPDKNTARRWLSAALKDTLFHFVERNKKFEGFVQTVPIEEIKRRRIYGSVDLGSPLFTRSVRVKRRDGSTANRLLFDEWADHALKTMPVGWKGLMLSSTDDIHNAGALPFARQSLYTRFSEFMGSTQSFQHHDPELAHSIVAATRMVEDYSDMIFDAAAERKSELFRLEAHSDRELNDPRGLKKLLGNNRGTNRAWRLSQLLQMAAATSENQAFLKSEIGKLAKKDQKAIRGFLSESAEKGILTDNPLLKVSLPTVNDYMDLLRWDEDWEVMQEWRDDSITKSLPLFFSYPGWQSHFSELRELAYTAGTAERLATLALHHATTVDQFIEYISVHIDNPTPFFEAEIGNLAKAHLPDFLKLKPSPNEKRRYLDSVRDGEAVFDILLTLAARADSQSEIDDLLSSFRARFTFVGEEEARVRQSIAERGFTLDPAPPVPPKASGPIARAIEFCNHYVGQLVRILRRGK